MSWPTTALGLILDGDSITTLAFTPPPPAPYWLYAQANLLPSGWGSQIADIAVAGEKVSTMAANLPGSVSSDIATAHSNGQVAVCWVFGGTNDLCNPTYPATTVSAVESSWQSYAAGARAAGADYVILGGILPRGLDGSDNTLPPQFNIDRQQCNADAALNYATWGFDAFTYIGDDPSFNNLANLTNNVLFGGDETHPLAAGHAIYANYFTRALMSIGSTATLTAIGPNRGAIAGGTLIEVHGSGFSGSPSPLVVIGGIIASSITVLSDTILTCVTGVSVGTGLGPSMVFTRLGSAILRNSFTWFNSTPPFFQPHQLSTTDIHSK